MIKEIQVNEPLLVTKNGEIKRILSNKELNDILKTARYEEDNGIKSATIDNGSPIYLYAFNNEENKIVESELCLMISDIRVYLSHSQKDIVEEVIYEGCGS